MEQRNFSFYIVPTPIGNIRDITFRAVDILNKVDIIACEDTRITQKLLNHYDIKTKCISYHKYNERERIDFFLNELRNGKRIALVSDAGTPMVCDPGNVIIEELNKNGFTVSALPGACAVTTFLSQLPRNNEEFTFIGFIPRSEKQIEEVVQKCLRNNLVFYESPERILKTLGVIRNLRGDIRVSIGRELSKLYEEVKTDTISRLLEHFKNGIRGEIVCLIYADENPETAELEQKISLLKSKGFKDKEISVILSTLYNRKKNEIYKRLLDM